MGDSSTTNGASGGVSAGHDRAIGADGVRIAAIDVGTNSIRVIVAESRPDGRYRIIDEEKAITRLGKGLEQSGEMSKESIEASADAIARMRVIAEGLGVEASNIHAVATSAAREASNPDDLVSLVRERAGIELEVIDADREAHLAFRSVATAFDIESQDVAIVDIGGGSTEIVLASGGEVVEVYPLKLGAVRLTDRFGSCDRPGHDGYEAMKSYINDVLKREVGKIPLSPGVMFGTGGTFSALANMSLYRSMGLAGAAMDVLPLALRGYEMPRREMRQILRWVHQMPVSARTSIRGLSPERADIIVAGMLIAHRVMKRLGVATLRVHDKGIRDGLLLSMIEELRGEAPVAQGRERAGTFDRVREARRFAEKCNVESRHAEHVAALSVSILDQLRAEVPATNGDADWATMTAREMLESAALMRDTGYLINYDKHHKHSYHLIVHSDLPGFDSRQLEIIANVARYHRGATPKKKHSMYGKLSPEDRRLVKRLAAVLRVADGLDRTHNQSVRSVRVSLEDGSAIFTLDSAEDPAVNVWGAERKGELFEKAWTLRPLFRWSARPAVVDGALL